MKTKISNHHIDLKRVLAIGPLQNGAHHGDTSFGGLGCLVYIETLDAPLFILMSEGEIRPFEIDDTKNAAIKAAAKANYDKFVTEWNAT